MSDSLLLEIENLGEKCCGCAACSATCPLKCITMIEDPTGFMYPAVDHNRCVGCGKCANVCPILYKGGLDTAIACYWAKSTDDEMLLSSSSGGLLGLLAKNVIEKGGVVYGAAFSDGMQALAHVRATTLEGLDGLKRSKYLQSCIDSDIYSRVLSDLASGLTVLYCGTPCQVLGLNRYLEACGTDSSRLIAIDVFCHGVPSPKLWRIWIRSKEEAFCSSVAKVNFRDKETGWVSYSVTYEFDNGLVSSVDHKDDWYMKAFLANASIRPSCFSCPAKRACGSDLTLGDYWGINKTHPEVRMEGGVSAVIANTAMGLKVFSTISKTLEYGLTSFENIVSGNRSAIASVKPFNDYDDFMIQLADGLDINQMQSRWSFKKPPIKAVAKKAKSLIKRFGRNGYVPTR